MLSQSLPYFFFFAGFAFVTVFFAADFLGALFFSFPANRCTVQPTFIPSAKRFGLALL